MNYKTLKNIYDHNIYAFVPITKGPMCPHCLQLLNEKK